MCELNGNDIPNILPLNIAIFSKGNSYQWRKDIW